MLGFVEFRTVAKAKVPKYGCVIGGCPIKRYWCRYDYENCWKAIYANDNPTLQYIYEFLFTEGRW